MNKFICILFISLLNYSAFAKELTIKEFDFKEMSYFGGLGLKMKIKTVMTVKTSYFEQKVILYNKSASETNAFFNKLINFSGKDIKINYPKNKEYLDITNLTQLIIPNIKLTNSPIVNSYNCHNTTLILADFAKYQNYTSDTEFKFYLQNFCERTDSPTSHSLSFYDHPMFSHSLTTIKDNLVFEKASNHMNKLYTFKRANTEGMVHYNCDSSKFNLLKCKNLDIVKLRLNELEKYFSKLAVSLALSGQLESRYKDLKNLLNDLQKVNLNGDSCQLIKESMKLKLESLESFYLDLKAGNLYGRGSYDTMGSKF